MPSHRLAPVLLAMLVALHAATGLRADTVTIEPVKDNALYEDADGALSNGAGDHFHAGRNGANGGFRAIRGALEFDVAGSVPAGATITGASLTLYLSQTPIDFTPRTIALHRATAEWGEGTSHAASGEGGGAPSTAGDATWIHTSYPSASWAAPGGDFDPTVSASVSALAIGSYAFSSAQLTSDVQAFFSTPAQNHGWIVLGDESVPSFATAKRFDSRTNPTASQRPKLEITYDPPSTSTGACCATDGSCTVVLDPGGSCGGSYQGAGTVCDPNSCPQPTGACCIPDAAATCNEVTEATCDSAGGSFEGALTTCAATACPVIPTAFADPLPVPAVATPISGAAGGVATYDIAMRETQQVLHSELPATTVWAYDDGATGPVFPGATIEATSDQAVTVNWINDLRDSSAPGSPKPLRTDHLLPVDLCPHGADDLPRTVVHLHGAHAPAEFDGHPEDTILPGQQDTYVYPNHQLPSTLWYHDHALGTTRLNVYLGLAGFYLIRDALENALDLPSGEFELPLVIQDRSFHPDGSFDYPAALQQVFFGDTILVNGRVWPFHAVKQGKYRLRVLNGSNSRHLTLEFCPSSRTSPCPSPASFDLLGQDGGLLPAPVPLTSITLGPAERADLVYDFAAHGPGTQVYLVNSAPAPFPGSPGVGVVPDVMRFDVGSQSGHTAALPGSLRSQELLDEQDAVAHREFELAMGTPDACAPFKWEIVSIENGSAIGSKWVDVVEYPELDTVEVWKFVNRSGMTHPMHMHLVMFQVLDRQDFTIVDDEVVPVGSPSPPAAEESGWKDTVQVGPNEIVRLIARFEDYTGLFPYHCHILEHEDHEMMRQFQTVQCGNGDPEPSEECDDGGTLPGDGCSDACELEDAASLYGTAQGGSVDITVDGVLLFVATSPGQTADQVAAAVAAAIEADPTLQQAGVGAIALGNRVVTTGIIDSLVLNDPGLSLAPPVPGPSASVLAALALLLVGVACWMLRRRASPA